MKQISRQTQILWQKKSRIKKGQKPFILLEVLIALMLLTLSLSPLIKEPLFLFKEELKMMENLEMERVQDLTFVFLKEKLYKNELSLQEGRFPLEDYPPFQREYSLSLKEKGSYAKVAVTVFLKSKQQEKKFIHLVCIKKIPAKNEL